jgi:uncharacterized membrane protein
LRQQGGIITNLFVLAFQDEQGASNMLKEVVNLRLRGLISIDDAATVVHLEGGKVKVRQAKRLAGPGAVGGAFWGMLFGLVFFVPFTGLALGSANGAMADKFADYGIDNDFIKQISRKVSPGTSALFLLARDAQHGKIIEAIEPYGGELLQSSQSSKNAAQLR